MTTTGTGSLNGCSRDPHLETNTGSLASKVLLLGLGNDILSDDAVGLNVVRELRHRLPESSGIEVLETCEMGLSLLDDIVGFDRLVLVDSIQTGRVPPGFVHALDGNELGAISRGSPHFFGLGETLALGKKLGLSIPRQVKVFAIETQDPFTVAVGLTPPLQKAFPAIVSQIFSALRD